MKRFTLLLLAFFCCRSVAAVAQAMPGDHSAIMQRTKLLEQISKADHKTHGDRTFQLAGPTQEMLAVVGASLSDPTSRSSYLSSISPRELENAGITTILLIDPQQDSFRSLVCADHLSAIDQLMDSGHPLVPAKVRMELNLNLTCKGLEVTQVSTSGASDKGGIKPGDILTGIDGVAVDSPSSLVRSLRNKNPGDIIEAELRRSGQPIIARVALEGEGGTPKTTQPVQDACKPYVGQTISPVTIDNVIDLVSKLPSVKDEFETTSQFEARLAESKRTMAPHYIVSSEAPDPQFLEYDADAQKLTIKSYALKNMGVFYDIVFGYGTSLYDKVKFSTIENKAVGISQTETKTGSYVASNAYGASVEVSRVNRRVKAIFDRDAGFDEKFFLNTRANAVIDKLDFDPAEAKRLKMSMRVAFVIVPKAPYYADGFKSWTPTIGNPTDLTEHLSVVIADIQCGLLTDSNNKVLGSYLTR